MRAVVLDLPFRGRWLTQNSLARRVPSHGTELFGTRYAIDFVPVDAGGQSAPLRPATLFATESPERFHGYGRSVLAPVSGTVVLAHDEEPDHRAYRTILPQLRYALTMGRRARAGWRELAGNHVVIAIEADGPFVGLVHLRQGSAQVEIGQLVGAGSRIAEVGNSGNSTEPHIHVQVNDSTDFETANGIPMRFRRPDGQIFVPDEGEIVEA